MTGLIQMKSVGWKKFKRGRMIRELVLSAVALATSVGQAATYRHVMLISVDGLHALEQDSLIPSTKVKTTAASAPNAISTNNVSRHCSMK
jgi:hypothetical protein